MQMHRSFSQPMCFEEMVKHGHSVVGSFAYIESLINQICHLKVKCVLISQLHLICLPVKVLSRSIHQRCRICEESRNKLAQVVVGHWGSEPVVI